MHTYKLKYKLKTEHGAFTKEELLNDPESGGTDALVWLSALYPRDGSFSVLLNSVDGRTGEEMADRELFKVWVMLANRLGRSKTLSPERASFCLDTFLVAMGGAT